MIILKKQIKKMRTGLIDIYQKYRIWCDDKNIVKLKKIDIKNGLSVLNYKEEAGKGVDINGKHGKRGYNVTI